MKGGGVRVDRAVVAAESGGGGPAALGTKYDLVVPADERRQLAAGWLYLALASLIGADVFSILLVLARTPFLQSWFPVADFFRVALVVHVDLSVLVWFFAVGGMLWTINGNDRLLGLGWAALGVAAAGTAVMSIAPFAGPGAPVMSNYIPVLDDPVFLTGLVAFGLGVMLLTLRSLAAVPPVGVRPDGAACLRFGLNAAAVSTAIAFIAFGWSHGALPPGLEARAYYDVLFCGGGHVIQFTFTLLMLVGWIWLASRGRGHARDRGRRLRVDQAVASRGHLGFRQPACAYPVSRGSRQSHSGLAASGGHAGQCARRHDDAGTVLVALAGDLRAPAHRRSWAVCWRAFSE